jgi:carboxyl-terminal processing protease
MGHMEEAIAIADELLIDKQLIVLLKIKKENTKTYATKNGFETGKVFVLQNENSASASEILAAIQDNDRGLSWDVVPSGKV